MQDQYGALERVVGKVKSGVNKVESFLSKNWQESGQPVSEFKDIRKLRDLQENYRSKYQSLNSNDTVGKAKLSSNFLSRYIVILRNYLSFFRLTNENINRYEQALIDMYESKRGPLTFSDGEDDSQPAVIQKVIRGLNRQETDPIRERVLDARNDIIKAIEDFHPNLASQVNSRYNLDIVSDLGILLTTLYNLNEKLLSIFEEAIIKAQEKYNRYQEQLRSTTQSSAPEQPEQEATDAYLSGNLNAKDKKIKIKVKK